MANKQKDHPGINKNIHPPVVALVYIIIAIVLGKLVSLPFSIPQILKITGLALTFVGFLLGVGAFIEFRKARTTLDPHGAASRLVVNGIYRFTRNPIYLGFLLMVIGFPLNYGFYWGILVAPLFMATMNRLVIEKEEAYLENKFRDEYSGYRSRVRRWL
ncbi:MAG: isoprenylcysteine carboxylmethyltransferase family protein [Chloroflexi bacterium]|nr:isoprenylcysteine carboxylmethyltransferase family protein [Chloroflexota bacterium]